MYGSSKNENSNNAKIDPLDQIPQMRYGFIIGFIILMTSRKKRNRVK